MQLAYPLTQASVADVVDEGTLDGPSDEENLDTAVQNPGNGMKETMGARLTAHDWVGGPS
ncbi:hypothetical protein [Streptomyces gibsoniae]|uniref:Aldo/keto reductase n=1 Tax=Streptomyces gibsoniae TaxID=3075529 RepID=A0ABU2U784_9ACTN|nr:hypothetical protein [Streptomyces sp. DSM 41699]MDT0469082.1 hypothetical protein [Streptomyces sp. DSM 41699]